MHLAMASTVEAQIAEKAKVCPSESCDRKSVIDRQMPASRNPVIDLQMPASLNLAVNRNINQFQHLMRGHGAAKMRHTYTATFICGGYATPDYLNVHTYLYEYS